MAGDGSATAPDVKSGTTKLNAQYIKDHAAVVFSTEKGKVDEQATDAVVTEMYTERLDFDKAKDKWEAYTKGCKGVSGTEKCALLKNADAT